MIVRLPGIANVTLLQNGRILIELTHGYGYAYVVCQTCYLLYLQWITFSSILLSGDIEPNPGPNTSMFSFCSWNLNSIRAHDFVRIPLIEAYNSVYNYDLLGIVETHLDSSVEDNKLILPGYTFVKRNHPSNTKRGGVGLYIREAFPRGGHLVLICTGVCL